ncbi:hypothetical protein GCM10009716_29810 [Streptomyces sodiiphilus]|uniref:Uncharacterized protein n=1 Tax=Streptomyces sodiiphilus TaxID=226217 RepID=A0ABP5AP79_9ACTN
MDEEPEPFTKEELLLGVALMQALIAEDTDAAQALQGEDEEGAQQAVRGLYALAHVIVYGLVVPEMWVIKKGLSYGHTRHVPELNLAICVMENIKERVPQAHMSDVVVGLTASDVLGLIVQCTETSMDEVPQFLDTVRDRTLSSMTS